MEPRESMASYRSAFLFLLLAWPCLLKPQEIKYIDLSAVGPRTELRHPPAPPADCMETPCGGGGYGSASIGDGAPDRRDPHALGIYLLRVTPTDIHTAEPFQVEFKILNTGTASIELPVSPHLSDLQPVDESVAFNYFSVALVVRGEREAERPLVNCVGFVELYGSPPSQQLTVCNQEMDSGDRQREVTGGLSRCWRFRGGFGCKKYVPSASRRSSIEARSVPKRNVHAVVAGPFTSP